MPPITTTADLNAAVRHAATHATASGTEARAAERAGGGFTTAEVTDIVSRAIAGGMSNDAIVAAFSRRGVELPASDVERMRPHGPASHGPSMPRESLAGWASTHASGFGASGGSPAAAVSSIGGSHSAAISNALANLDPAGHSASEVAQALLDRADAALARGDQAGALRYLGALSSLRDRIASADSNGLTGDALTRTLEGTGGPRGTMMLSDILNLSSDSSIPAR